MAIKDVHVCNVHYVKQFMLCTIKLQNEISGRDKTTFLNLQRVIISMKLMGANMTIVIILREIRQNPCQRGMMLTPLPPKGLKMSSIILTCWVHNTQDSFIN